MYCVLSRSGAADAMRMIGTKAACLKTADACVGDVRYDIRASTPHRYSEKRKTNVGHAVSVISNLSPCSK